MTRPASVRESRTKKVRNSKARRTSSVLSDNAQQNVLLCKLSSLVAKTLAERFDPQSFGTVGLGFLERAEALVGANVQTSRQQVRAIRSLLRKYSMEGRDLTQQEQEELLSQISNLYNLTTNNFNTLDEAKNQWNKDYVRMGEILKKWQKNSQVRITSETRFFLNQFEGIRESFTDFKVKKEEGSGFVVTWTTPPITIEYDDHTYHFGPFCVGILFNPYVQLLTNPDDSVEFTPAVLKLKPLKPRYPYGPGGERRTSNPHPHVSSVNLSSWAYLCLGNVKLAVYKALQSGRFLDVANLALSVLSNYNPESPFPGASIGYFRTPPCKGCGGEGGETMTVCEVCRHRYCGDCISKCERCGLPTCKGHLDRCGGSCGKEVCTECARGRCRECGKSHICRDCGLAIELPGGSLSLACSSECASKFEERFTQHAKDGMTLLDSDWHSFVDRMELCKSVEAASSSSF